MLADMYGRAEVNALDSRAACSVLDLRRAECAAKCGQDPKCRSWEYDKNTTLCQLGLQPFHTDCANTEPAGESAMVHYDNVWCRLGGRFARLYVLFREDNSESWNRTWEEYKAGFGVVGSGSFWLGLDRLHWLTVAFKRVMTIKVTLMDGSVEYRSYRNTYVDDEAHNYQLSLSGGKNSNFSIHDCFGYLDGANFSTVDRDNNYIDGQRNDCAARFGGGWWYLNTTCGMCNAVGNFTWPEDGVWDGEEKHAFWECAAKCGQDPKCRSWEYDKNTTLCQLGLQPFHTDCANTEPAGESAMVHYDNVWCRLGGTPARLYVLIREDNSESWNRTWEEYKAGFGDLGSGSFWLGLDRLHWLTAAFKRTMTIKLTLMDGSIEYKRYKNIYVDDEAHNYQLSISGGRNSNYSIQDCFGGLAGANFSTVDRDNNYIDGQRNDCAARFGGGWWYLNTTCGMCNAVGNLTWPEDGVWDGEEKHAFWA
nr:hypothetical protein BaRGS_024503 [Batillaria attramentaria]